MFNKKYADILLIFIKNTKNMMLYVLYRVYNIYNTPDELSRGQYYETK